MVAPPDVRTPVETDPEEVTDDEGDAMSRQNNARSASGSTQESAARTDPAGAAAAGSWRG
jgi:hypothetical protein